MEVAIVQTHTFLTLLGGGSVTSGELARALDLAPILVAADGGAETALDAGITPQAVIGDFDSLTDQVKAQLDPSVLHPNDDQDTTDFEKCLARVAAPLILGVGFTGLRRDHELAAYHGLLRFAHQRCILIADQDVIMLCPPKLRLDLPEGTRVSLFPMAPVIAQGTGLRWPLTDLALAPGGRIGTSNIAQGGPVEIAVDQPGLLLILPVEKLETLVDALATNTSAWPT